MLWQSMALVLTFFPASFYDAVIWDKTQTFYKIFEYILILNYCAPKCKKKTSNKSIATIAVTFKPRNIWEAYFNQNFIIESARFLRRSNASGVPIDGTV